MWSGGGVCPDLHVLWSGSGVRSDLHVLWSGCGVRSDLKLQSCELPDVLKPHVSRD